MEQKEVKQEPLEKEPIPDTNFDNDRTDVAPLASGGGFGLTSILERSFEMMRPKEKKTTKIPRRLYRKIDEPIATEKISSNEYCKINGNPVPNSALLPEPPPIPKGYEVKNGILLQKKSFIEKARDQLKYPWLNSAPNITKGLAVVVLAIGIMAIYAEIPSHPGIVVGIVLVSLAGSLIISGR